MFSCSRRLVLPRGVVWTNGRWLRFAKMCRALMPRSIAYCRAHHTNSLPRSRGAFLRPGFATLASLTPNRGVGGAPGNVRVLGGTPVGRIMCVKDVRERAYDAIRQALASLALRTVFARLFSQPRRKAHMSHQKVSAKLPTEFRGGAA